MGFLYKLDFPNRKSYIGMTERSVEGRYWGHARAAEKGSSLILSRAWRKHGTPKLRVLAIVENRLLKETERRTIAAFHTMTPNGYNMTPGGETSPAIVPEIAKRMEEGRRRWRASPECHATLSNAAKRRLSSPKERKRLSKLHQQWWSKASPETRARSTEAMRWFVNNANPMKNPEIAAKSGATKRGRPAPWAKGKNNVAHRPEVKAKYSGENSATKRPEVRAKISAALKGNTNGKANRGRKYSPETLARMSAAQIGKKQSEETKAKRSAMWRGENNPMKRPEVVAKLKGDNNPMRNPLVVAKALRIKAMKRENRLLIQSGDTQYENCAG